MTAPVRTRFIGAGLVIPVLAAPLAMAQFYGDPPDETHPWGVHDMNRPQPRVVTPGAKPGDPPSDAVVLFDGTGESLQNWVHEKEKRKGDWQVVDGALQCTPGAGYIRSKEEFGDCQLHLEWAAPSAIKGEGQGRGNSGVFLMGMTEIQILDNYENPTYPDGSAGSVYGVMPPEVNALRKPGEWQVYDIIFRRPIVKDGEVLDEGAFTVFVNGVVVQDNTPLEGGGGHKKRSKPRPFPETGPLKIQDHGNPVRFRNIWYRPLRKRPVDGGTDGKLSPEATAKKRAETAADLVKQAAAKENKEKLMLLLGSLVYHFDDNVAGEAEALGAEMLAKVKAMSDQEVEAAKKDILDLDHAARYLVKHGVIPGDNAVVAEFGELIKSRGWKPKRL